jgi:hypothetical protein
LAALESSQRASNRPNVRHPGLARRVLVALLLFALLLVACGDPAGADAGSPMDARITRDGTILDDGGGAADGSHPDAGGGDGGGASVDAGPCRVDLGFTCSATATCCEGRCHESAGYCCVDEGSGCGDGLRPGAIEDGCCPGLICDAASSECVVKTCEPTIVPGASGTACAPDDELPCCETSSECTEDPIYGFWCCGPAGTTVEDQNHCCSGNVEILGGGRFRCLAR